MVVRGLLESLEMASSSRTTTQQVPFQVAPFVFPPSEGIGPPFIATLNIPGLTIGLLLYTRMAPLRLSVNFLYVGTQKDTYGLRFS